jgi:5-methylthioadenosine/S-adenosylhomocysteine deaminase
VRSSNSVPSTAHVCANVEGKVGTLTPGKEADLLMLKADSIDVWPLNNAYGAVVNLMDPAHVEAVFIAGQVRKWRGNLVGVDMRHVLRSMQEAAMRAAPGELPN